MRTRIIAKSKERNFQSMIFAQREVSQMFLGAAKREDFVFH
jgi:hypothetical protein